MDDTNYLIIHSLAMVNWLCNNGHKIVKVRDSKKDKNLKLFYFQDSMDIYSTMARFPSNMRV